MSKSKVSQTRSIDEVELPDAPMFYKSASGGPYVSRLGGGIDVRKNMFNILETVDIKGVVIPMETGAYTYYHTLGYTPFVIGSYIMRNATVAGGIDYPEIHGFIPEDRYPKYGGAIQHSVYISYADSSLVRIRVATDADTATYDFRLHFLREKGLDEDS